MMHDVYKDDVVELNAEYLPASHALQRFENTCSNNTVDDEEFDAVSVPNFEVGGVNPDRGYTLTLNTQRISVSKNGGATSLPRAPNVNEFDVPPGPKRFEFSTNTPLIYM